MILLLAVSVCQCVNVSMCQCVNRKKNDEETTRRHPKPIDELKSRAWHCSWARIAWSTATALPGYGIHWSAPRQPCSFGCFQGCTSRLCLSPSILLYDAAVWQWMRVYSYSHSTIARRYMGTISVWSWVGNRNIFWRHWSRIYPPVALTAWPRTTTDNVWVTMFHWQGSHMTCIAYRALITKPCCFGKVTMHNMYGIDNATMSYRQRNHI